MVTVADNLKLVTQKINQSAQNAGRNFNQINLVAVSKNANPQAIKDAINSGCKIFGENRVLDAKKKWFELKKESTQIKLHLIGHLQTNKVKEALQLFDVIETLDSEKLAKTIAVESEKQKKKPEIFVQVNIGREPQKSGIDPDFADQLIKLSQEQYQLNLTGVMGIAPLNCNPKPYFELLAAIARKNNLPNISMGMSLDFEIAIACGANYVRLGGAIFDN